jgi:hypothetical protein
MSWGIIELELNVWARLLKVLIDMMIPFPHKKNHKHKSSWWLITFIMLYMLQVYVTKWASTNCVVLLFIILLGTCVYVLWILKIMLITSPWNVLDGMIVFLAFGYCISFIICVCVSITLMF